MNKFHAVSDIWPVSSKTRPFGVPLHAEDGSCCVFQGFSNTVRGGLRDRKMAPDPPAALMMSAVDGAGISVETVKDRTGSVLNRMKLIASGILMRPAGREILNDISAEVYVDDLQSPADAEDRFPGPDEHIEKGELYVVQRRVDRSGTKVRLSEPGGMNIPAAREQELVIDRKVRRRKVCAEGDRKMSQCFFVVFCVFRETGNQNIHGSASGDGVLL